MEKLEIERSWLLKNIPTNLTFDRQIDQFYTADGIRLRASYFLDGRTVYDVNQKRPRGNGMVGYFEAEEEISKKDFLDLFPKAKKYISKDRFTRKSGNLIWEIDVFISIVLIKAEIELPDDTTEVIIEDWLSPHIIMETTTKWCYNSIQT